MNNRSEMIMIQKLMRNSAAAAGFAALLLVGACASHDKLSSDTADTTDQVIQVQPEASTVDVAGNMDRSPIVPDSTTVTTVDTTASLNTSDTAPVITTPSVSTTTTTVETTNAPMTSSLQESTSTTTTDDDDDDDDATPARTRMRKD